MRRTTADNLNRRTPVFVGKYFIKIRLNDAARAREKKKIPRVEQLPNPEIENEKV